MANVIELLDSREKNFVQKLRTLKTLPNNQNQNVQKVVTKIITNVRDNGDKALLEYTKKFDNYNLADPKLFEISKAEIKKAQKKINPELLKVLKISAQRILKYHSLQKLSSINLKESKGSLGYRIQALKRVALYVPGGKAAYPSSVLMNAIPAKVAGVKELIIITPAPNGDINCEVLAAASVCGVDKIYTIGGAQAIAAVAYGTKSIPRCDKVVGPGNAYVAEAKRQVFGAIGIDMVAGPSEVLVISDGSGNPKWVAADLLAQAEHDEWAQSILICTDKKFMNAVEKAIIEFLPILPRREIISKSLKNRGALILVKNLDEAIVLADEIAPEHLVIATDEKNNPPLKIANKINFAGGIFLGHYSCEVLGDYCAGTNHVLPTAGSARFSSPLSVYDFYKGSAILNLDKKTVAKVAPLAEIFANSEGLQAHALAARLRK